MVRKFRLNMEICDLNSTMEGKRGFSTSSALSKMICIAYLFLYNHSNILPENSYAFANNQYCNL